jgi:hypothetical protein
MNEFKAKNEQAFLDACGAIGVEPNAMIEPHKERHLVSELLKDPVSWLETERLYYSYTTPGEAQEVANDSHFSQFRPSGDSTKANRFREGRELFAGTTERPAFVLRERIIQNLGAPSAESRSDQNPVNTISVTDYSIDGRL